MGIGASAGGLEPLERLLAHLEPGRLANVVLQHLAPTRDSLLRELLTTREYLQTSIAELAAASKELQRCDGRAVAVGRCR